MSDTDQRLCVMLPCREDLHWAVPQNCLAEIVTVPATGADAPHEVEWRGLSVPVLDFGVGGTLPWREDKSGTGLVVVFLGVRGQGCDYWGLALRGSGLGVRRLDSESCRDLPEPPGDYALAAFEFEGRVYQVPDLPALQVFAREEAKAKSA